VAAMWENSMNYNNMPTDTSLRIISPFSTQGLCACKVGLRLQKECSKKWTYL